MTRRRDSTQVLQEHPELAHDMFEALPEASKAAIRAQAAPPEVRPPAPGRPFDPRQQRHAGRSAPRR